MASSTQSMPSIPYADSIHGLIHALIHGLIHALIRGLIHALTRVFIHGSFILLLLNGGTLLLLAQVQAIANFINDFTLGAQIHQLRHCLC